MAGVKGKSGGSREGAGRLPTKATQPGGAGFALAVLNRIGKLKLRGIKDYEDYALELLKAQDVRVRKEVFIALLLWLFGKPAQAVELSNAAGQPFEIVVRNIGNLSKPE